MQLHSIAYYYVPNLISTINMGLIVVQLNMARSKRLTIFVRNTKLRSMLVTIPQQLTITNVILISMSISIPKSACTMHGPQCIAQSP
jgi:hypothetical protein